MGKHIAFAAFIVATAMAASGAATAPAESRGELLYTTYCVGCHTSQVHWRDGRLARDWPTLKAEVTRWQKTAGLALDGADIDALAAYLNDLYYHFPEGDTRRAGDRRVPAAPVARFGASERPATAP